MTTCGAFGGLTNKNEPCKRTAGWGVPDEDSGRCKTHLDQIPEPETYTAPLGYTYVVTMEGNVTAATEVTLTPQKAEAPVEPDPPDPEPEPEPEPDPEPPPPDPDPDPPPVGDSNEPASFELWARHDLAHGFPETLDEAVVPMSERGNFVLAGVSAHVGRAKVSEDARFDDGHCLRILWPKGMSVGSGMFNYAIRQADSRRNPDRINQTVPLQRWYIRYQYLLEPDANGQWEMHWDQLRFVVGNRHITSGGPSGNTAWGWTLRGQSNSGASGGWGGGHFADRARAYRLWGFPSADGSTETLASVAHEPRVGAVHTVELLFDATVRGEPLFGIDDAGVGPCRVKVWHNGALLMDETPTWHMSHPFLELFINLNQSGGVSPATDKYIRMSVPYISGERYEGEVFNP